MTITLKKDELLQAIRHRSHEEVSGIADAEARYRIEANIHKNEEVFQAMADVSGRLKKLLNRFLDDFYETDADNTLDIPNSYVYDLNLTTRAAASKGDALARLMHSYFVDYTLAKFYAAVSSVDLSNKHSALAMDTAALLESMLYEKKEPIL